MSVEMTILPLICSIDYFVCHVQIQLVILCKNRQTNDVMFKNNVWTFCENYEREGNANVETKTSWNYNGSFHIRGGVIYHLPLTPLAPKTNRRA
jgi:hypothetical protein